MSGVVPEDVCVCLCVRAVEAVSVIELGSMESPGDYITHEVSGSVCACVHVCK